MTGGRVEGAVLGLPAVFAFAAHASAGALVTYGIDLTDAMLQTTEYVDRILRGTKPADLPVQAPKTFELVVNLKTGKSLVSPFHRRCWLAPTK